MANTIVTEIMIDGPRNTVVKIVCDQWTLNLNSTVVVDPSTLTAINPGMSGSPPPTLVRVDKVEYSISDGAIVELLWVASTYVTMVELYGRGKVEAKQFGGMPNNAAPAGRTGQLAAFAAPYESGGATTVSFTITLEMVKWYANE